MKTRNDLQIYLSGPIEYAKDFGIQWRLEAEEAILDAGFRCFNPNKHALKLLRECGLNNESEFGELKTSNYSRYRSIMFELIQIDMQAVRKSDIVLAHVSPVASGGTSGELTLAQFLGIYNIGFCTDSITQVSGWVGGCLDQLFEGENSLHRAIIHTIRLAEEFVSES